MALTVTQRQMSVFGDDKVVFATVTFDSSYPTGGEALGISDFAGVLRQIDWVQVPAANDGATRLVTWDRANAKLKLYTALSTEATNASNQSTISIDVVVYGK